MVDPPLHRLQASHRRREIANLDAKDLSQVGQRSECRVGRVVLLPEAALDLLVVSAGQTCPVGQLLLAEAGRDPSPLELMAGASATTRVLLQSVARAGQVVLDGQGTQRTNRSASALPITPRPDSSRVVSCDLGYTSGYSSTHAIAGRIRQGLWAATSGHFPPAGAMLWAEGVGLERTSRAGEDSHRGGAGVVRC